MRNMQLRLKNQAGFTLIEMMLALVVGGLLLAFLSQFFLEQANTYAFVSNRKSTVSDIRYAMNRMNHELMRVDPGSDITSFDTTNVYFNDTTGTPTNYRLATLATGELGIYRGPDLMISNVKTFHLEYYDNSGGILNPLTSVPSDIARIQIKILSDPQLNEGDIVMRTTVTPRSVIGYQNFD